ncbi:MAG: phosphoribosyltransferase, partial [Frankiales bacterium]|nr:phosphoribosyltransferase [Frankiales bacterium]
HPSSNDEVTELVLRHAFETLGLHRVELRVLARPAREAGVETPASGQPSLRSVTDEARAAVLRQFRWVEGHADIWRVFADSQALRHVVEGLAEPWRDAGVTRVVGIEARGFLLGGATAVALGVGFVAIRKSDTSLLPGPKVRATAVEDYRGIRHDLRMQSVLAGDDRVLLVDDWAEKGSQALAAATLVGACSAQFLGLSVVVDMLTDDLRETLGRVTSLVRADELGPSDRDNG